MIKHNNVMMEQLSGLRKDIRNEELNLDNYNLDLSVNTIKAKDVEPEIKPPGPGNPRPQNLFKRHIDEQKKAIVTSVELLTRTVALAITDNKPILANN